MIFIFSSPHSIFHIFFNRFLAFFLTSSSSEFSLSDSRIFLNRLNIPSILVTYPFEATAGSTDIFKEGILTVACELLTTLILKSSLGLLTSNSILQGSFSSTASTSA